VNTTRRARVWCGRASGKRIARAGSPPLGACRAGLALAGVFAILVATLALPLPASAQSTAWVEGEAAVNGIVLRYATAGAAGGEPILLIPGTAMQLTEWPPALIEGLAERGYRVITFDPRDVGLSTHFVEAGLPDWGSILGALAAGGRRRYRTPWTTSRTTRSGSSMPSPWTAPTSSASRWEGWSRRSSPRGARSARSR